MILLIDIIIFSISFLLIYLLKRKYRNSELNEIEEDNEIRNLLSIYNNIHYYDVCNIYIKKKYLTQNNKMIKIRH